jgi:hypothetical protein
MVTDSHWNWSCNSIEAHQSSSIVNSGDRTSAPRNTEGTENAQGIASSNNEDEDLELEKGYKMINVCDRLIEVFMIEKPKTSEWRKLLAFSKEWSKIRPHFFKWCKVWEDAETDPEKKQKLLKLGRKLKEVSYICRSQLCMVVHLLHAHVLYYYFPQFVVMSLPVS